MGGARDSRHGPHGDAAAQSGLHGGQSVPVLHLQWGLGCAAALGPLGSGSSRSEASGVSFVARTSLTSAPPPCIPRPRSAVAAEPWHPAVAQIRARLEEITGASFNSCLLNLYRTGAPAAWASAAEPTPRSARHAGAASQASRRPQGPTTWAGTATTRPFMAESQCAQSLPPEPGCCSCDHPLSRK